MYNSLSHKRKSSIRTHENEGNFLNRQKFTLMDEGRFNVISSNSLLTCKIEICKSPTREININF